MKQLLQTAPVVHSNIKVDGESSAYGFDQGRMAHLMEMLRELYSTPVTSVIRELIANGLDAHEINNSQEKITVALKPMTGEGNNYVLYIRDFGPGLTAAEVTKYIFTYGGSKSAELVDARGFYGVGAKSPAAISNKYLVHVWNEEDGHHAWASALSNTNESIKIPLLEPTGKLIPGEQTGILFEIPLKPEMVSQATEWFRSISQGDIAHAFTPRVLSKLDIRTGSVETLVDVDTGLFPSHVLPSAVPSVRSPHQIGSTIEMAYVAANSPVVLSINGCKRKVTAISYMEQTRMPVDTFASRDALALAKLLKLHVFNSDGTVDVNSAAKYSPVYMADVRYNRVDGSSRGNSRHERYLAMHFESGALSLTPSRENIVNSEANTAVLEAAAGALYANETIWAEIVELYLADITKYHSGCDWATTAIATHITGEFLWLLEAASGTHIGSPPTIAFGKGLRKLIKSFDADEHNTPEMSRVFAALDDEVAAAFMAPPQQQQPVTGSVEIQDGVLSTVANMVIAPRRVAHLGQDTDTKWHMEHTSRANNCLCRASYHDSAVNINSKGRISSMLKAIAKLKIPAAKYSRRGSKVSDLCYAISEADKRVVIILYAAADRYQGCNYQLIRIIKSYVMHISKEQGLGLFDKQEKIAVQVLKITDVGPHALGVEKFKDAYTAKVEAMPNTRVMFTNTAELEAFKKTPTFTDLKDVWYRAPRESHVEKVTREPGKRVTLLEDASKHNLVWSPLMGGQGSREWKELYADEVKKQDHVAKSMLVFTGKANWSRHWMSFKAHLNAGSCEENTNIINEDTVAIVAPLFEVDELRIANGTGAHPADWTPGVHFAEELVKKITIPGIKFLVDLSFLNTFYKSMRATVTIPAVVAKTKAVLAIEQRCESYILLCNGALLCHDLKLIEDMGDMVDAEGTTVTSKALIKIAATAHNKLSGVIMPILLTAPKFKLKPMLKKHAAVITGLLKSGDYAHLLLAAEIMSRVEVDARHRDSWYAEGLQEHMGTDENHMAYVNLIADHKFGPKYYKLGQPSYTSWVDPMGTNTSAEALMIDMFEEVHDRLLHKPSSEVAMMLMHTLSKKVKAI